MGKERDGRYEIPGTYIDVQQGEGRTAKEAFEYATDTLEQDGLAVCVLGEEMVKKYKVYREENIAKAEAFIKENASNIPGYGSDIANYVNLGVVGYQVVRREVKKEDVQPKYKKGYYLQSDGRVYEKSGKPVYFGSYEEAEKVALQLSERLGTNVGIHTGYVLVGGSSRVGKVQTVIKRYKTEPKVKKGEVIIPEYKYLFFW